MNRGTAIKNGYCLFVDSVCEGPVPIYRDESGRPVVFTSLHDAQLEFADRMIVKLQEFIDGNREFEDAIDQEEYIVSVDIDETGVISDEHGNAFAFDGPNGLVRIA